MSARIRERTGWLLAFAVALGGSGCQSLHSLGLPANRADRGAKETTTTQGPLPPKKHQFRDGQFLYLYDFDLKSDQPIFKDLARLRDQVTRELRLPTSANLVQIYLFEDKERYERFMQAKFPDLPKRRAFFVAQPRGVGGPEDLMVYTFWGDRIQEDLRHELTHALLHSVLKDVPLWLDEGLAEFFEVAADAKGINVRHLDYLRRESAEPFRPDLPRLEQLREVKDMTPAEYREAWAWVHLLLRDKPAAKKLLVDYLQQLRTNPNPGPLSPRLGPIYPQLNDALSKHLARLEAQAPIQRVLHLGIQ